MAHPDTEYDPDRVVVRDRRRLDPETGLPREAAATPPPADGVAEPAETVEVVPDRVDELTADLQRLSAEYANYRKRVQRDQVAVAEAATAGLVDVDRARAHGDLQGAFKVVGEGLEGLVTRLGFERYGEPGDAFDPQVHEAVMSAPEDPAATAPACAQVFSPGYRSTSPGGRVLRAAKVAVAEPGAAPDGAAPAPGA